MDDGGRFFVARSRSALNALGTLTLIWPATTRMKKVASSVCPRSIGAATAVVSADAAVDDAPPKPNALCSIFVANVGADDAAALSAAALRDADEPVNRTAPTTLASICTDVDATLRSFMNDLGEVTKRERGIGTGLDAASCLSSEQRTRPSREKVSERSELVNANEAARKRAKASALGNAAGSR